MATNVTITTITTTITTITTITSVVQGVISSIAGSGRYFENRIEPPCTYAL